MGLGIESEAKLKEKLAGVKELFWDDHDVPISVALARVSEEWKPGFPKRGDSVLEENPAPNPGAGYGVGGPTP